MLGRLLVIALGVATATAAHADPVRNDPGFLGIKMSDVPQIGGCHIDSLVPFGAAASAGFAAGEIIVGVDATPIPACAALSVALAARDAGDLVRFRVLDVRRGAPLVREVALTSRGEAMRRALLGRPLAIPLGLVTDDAIVDAPLASKRTDEATILGYFTPTCSACAPVFARVAAFTAANRRVRALAVTFAPPTIPPTSPSALAARYPFDLPLALTPNVLTDDAANLLYDDRRITFMVVDARGVVVHVAPLAVEGEDAAAALDELFVAATSATTASHGSNARTRR